MHGGWLVVFPKAELVSFPRTRIRIPLHYTLFTTLFAVKKALRHLPSGKVAFITQRVRGGGVYFCRTSAYQKRLTIRPSGIPSSWYVNHQGTLHLYRRGRF